MVITTLIGCAHHQPEPVLRTESRAYYWLSEARAGADKGFIDNVVIVDLIKFYLEKEKISLKDIGTSEEELTQLIYQDKVSFAKSYLRSIRQRSLRVEVGGDIRLFKEYLGKINLTPQDIGSNEKELIEIIRQGHISEAEFWLNDARKSADKFNVSYIIGLMEKTLVEGNLSYEDIGTNEDEINALLRIGYAAKANDLLFQLRLIDPEQIDPCQIVDLISCINKSRATLEEIGTNYFEMENFKTIVRKKGCTKNKRLD